MQKTIQTMLRCSLFLLFILVSHSSSAQSCNSQYLKYNYRFVPPTISSNAYDLSMTLDTTYDGKNAIVTSIVLGDFSYFISPYSADKATGALRIVLFDNRYVIMDSAYTEIPQSIAIPDEHQGGKTHVVDNNTVYLKNIDIKTREDFEVSGFVRFVIEPKCTMENIEFILKQRDGKLSIEMVKESC